MNKSFTGIALSGIMLIATSCASIVSKSNYPISINSTPSEAKISITDKKGKQIYIGQTPAIVKLESGSGFLPGTRSYLRKLVMPRKLFL